MTSVDVDALFENFTIREVHEIEKKLQGDMEQKKEDLRQMVGRRYRDIIEAADSVNEMKSLSNKITASMKQLHDGFDRLQKVEQQLITVQQRAAVMSRLPISSEEQRETSLKFLLDIPELIYESLDDVGHEDFLSAVWFCLLGEFLLNEFKLSDWCDRAALASPSLELRELRRQLTNQLESANVGDGCSESSSPNANRLCALVLVRSLSLQQLLERFLEMKKGEVRQLWSGSEGDAATSRQKICDCVELVVTAVMGIRRLFALSNASDSIYFDDASTNRVSVRLQEVLSNGWKPGLRNIQSKRYLSYLDLQGRRFAAQLPENIKDFKPTILDENIGELTQEDVKSRCASFMADTSSECGEQIGRWLENFDDIGSLTALKNGILSSLVEFDACGDKWQRTCEMVFGCEFRVYDSLLAESVERRVQTLCEKRISFLFNRFIDAAKVGWDKELQWPDFNDFLWDPSSLIDAVEFCKTTNNAESSADRGSSRPGVLPLTLKAKGVRPELLRICTALDAGLAELSSLCSAYMGVELEGPTSRLPLPNNYLKAASVSAASSRLQSAIADCCVESLKRLSEEFVSAAASGNFEKKHPVLDSSSLAAVALAQLCHALVEICPSLRDCLCLSSAEQSARCSSAEIRKRTTEPLKWFEAKECMTNAASSLFAKWAESALSDAVKVLGCLEEFRSSLLEPTLLLSCAQEFEVIRLEGEETDDDEKLTSSVAVPLLPSRVLCRALRSLSASVNAVGAHRLPQKAVGRLGGKFRDTLFLLYETSLETRPPPRQKQALQLLFDVRLLALLFPLDAKKTAAEAVEQRDSNAKFGELVRRLEGEIDPFDLDLMKPHLKRNLSRSSQQLSSWFGVLLTADLGQSSRRPADVAVPTEQSQLLPLNAVAVDRFQLLPLAGPAMPPPKVGVLSAMSPGAGSKESHSGAIGKSTQKASAVPKVASTVSLSSFYDKISTSFWG